VEVIWPSGQIDRLKEVAANQVLTLKEGTAGKKESGFPTTFLYLIDFLSGWAYKRGVHVGEIFSRKFQFGQQTALHHISVQVSKATEPFPSSPFLWCALYSRQ
jgi:hypothetical protein